MLRSCCDRKKQIAKSSALSLRAWNYVSIRPNHSKRTYSSPSPLKIGRLFLVLEVCVPFRLDLCFHPAVNLPWLSGRKPFSTSSHRPKNRRRERREIIAMQYVKCPLFPNHATTFATRMHQIIILGTHWLMRLFAVCRILVWIDVRDGLFYFLPTHINWLHACGFISWFLIHSAKYRVVHFNFWCKPRRHLRIRWIQC